MLCRSVQRWLGQERTRLEAGADELGFFLLSIDMRGAGLGREPAIWPALHLCYWPIQIETFFFIFYIACSCVGKNKTSMGQPGQLKLGAQFPATRGGRPYQPLRGVAPFCVYDWIVKNILVALLIYPQNG